jgi:hypothetical protein
MDSFYSTHSTTQSKGFGWQRGVVAASDHYLSVAVSPQYLSTLGPKRHLMYNMICISDMFNIFIRYTMLTLMWLLHFSG